MEVKHEMSGKVRPHILLGCTGSVASIKVHEIASMLHKFADVKVIATSSALHFLDVDAIAQTVCPVLTDETEWHAWTKKGDPVLHIDLREWADLLIIAPLSANSMAKLANGMADNLLLSVARAWDFEKPFIVCPAMNTQMYTHPVTEPQLQTLKSWKVTCVDPVVKTLACNITGIGALAAPDTIVQTAIDRLKQTFPQWEYSDVISHS